MNFCRVIYQKTISTLNKLKTPPKDIRNFYSGVLASPARFERTAFRLGGERSILLSYGDIYIYVPIIL